MSKEQKEMIIAAQQTEYPVALVELDMHQVNVLNELGIEDLDTINEMARAALASVIKGKMQAAIDRAIKAKYVAENNGKKALAEECEAEIQRGLALKRKLL